MHTLSPPPRHVPFSLRILNLFSGAAQLGWAIFGFGMIFVWFFASEADFSFLTFRGPHHSVAGTVTRVDDTGASENNERVRANHYQFSVAGRTLTGTSYSTGRLVEEGQAVTVEFAAGDPQESRIAGMRRKLFGPWAAFVLVFPAIGAGFIVFAVRSGFRRNRLLREGLLATGELKAKEATNMRVNKQTVYELTFEFIARDGRRHEARARTHVTARLEDEAREPLLYDPMDPARAYVLDDAPARPQFGVDGQLQGRPGAALGSLIIPAAVLVAHGLVLYGKTM